MENSLIRQGNLNKAMGSLISKEETKNIDLRYCLDHIKDEGLRLLLRKELVQSDSILVALRGGYVPIEGGTYFNINSNSFWLRKDVQKVVDTMPPEIKDAMEEAKTKGGFTKFAIAGEALGDPVLVGKAGKKNFLIGTWLNFEGGSSAGFTLRSC